MIERNLVETKKMFKDTPANRSAARRDVLPGGKFHEHARAALLILAKEPGRRFKKAYFSWPQQQSLARLALGDGSDGHILVDVLTGENEDPRTYWFVAPSGPCEFCDRCRLRTL